MDETQVRAETGRLLDPMRAQQQLLEGASVGEADVLVARYGVPDTGVPHGLDAQRVIDSGAFDDIIADYPARSEKQPIPFFLDHGWAHIHPPFVESAMKLGKVGAMRSEEAGLVGAMQWNLTKPFARDAFSDAVFDPYGTKFSYRWNEEETYRGTDGLDHERRVGRIVEVSQLSLSAAQQDTWVFPESVKMRTATHHTEVGSPSEANLIIPTDFPPDLFRMAFAAMDTEGDPDAISSYWFPHHVVTDGKIGMAHVEVCTQIIEDLNKSRGMAEDQRVAAYRHAAGHIRDAGKTPDKLRAAMPTLEEFTAMLEDSVFAAEIEDLMRGAAPTSALGLRRHMAQGTPNGHGKDKDDIAEMGMESLSRRHTSIHEGDNAPHDHSSQRSEDLAIGELVKARTGEIITLLLDDGDFRAVFDKALHDAEELRDLADPAKWYRRTWEVRV
jgi:hypothetical protein